MSDIQGKADWVLRVLGVQIGSGASTPTDTAPPVPLPELLPLWVQAKESTDRGIEQLQRALRGTNDPDLVQIAEYGLNGVTSGRMNKLMVALREAGGAATPEVKAKVSGAAQEFRGFLAGSPIVSLLEENPFGVTVPLRQTLGSALDQIERAVSA